MKLRKWLQVVSLLNQGVHSLPNYFISVWSDVNVHFNKLVMELK